MSWSEPALAQVAELVGSRIGMTFAHREGSVELGIRRAMGRAGFRDLPAYLDRLAGSSRQAQNAFDDLVSELTIGETYFFREPEQFERIRREVLPELRTRRGPDQIIRVWSAGCASGEEAYSLAIVLEQEGFGERAHVLATDVSQKALAVARKGTYGKWSLRGENGTDALPFLERSGDSYQIAEAIQRRVTFASLNLARDVYPSFSNCTWGMDLILCRNVLIYFDRDTVQSVARRLLECLNVGGWLITASADPPLWDCAPFEVVATNQGVIYRRPAASGEWQVASGEMNAGDDAVSEVPVSRSPPASAGPPESAVSVAGDLRAMAGVAPAEALAKCEHVLVEFPFSSELSYLHAMLLLDAGREKEALRALRRVIYLDRSLAVAHFTLASMLRRRGDLSGARRAYRNARDLSAALPGDAVLPLGEGEKAGRLAEVATAELAFLEGVP